MLAAIFDGFESCAIESSRIEKEDILKRLDSPALRALLSCACDPYRRVFVQVGSEVPTGAQTPLGDDTVLDAFLALFSVLESRKLTGDAARAAVINFLASTPEKYVAWFVAVLNKDLKIGVGPATINKLFPGLIPVFSVQLCPSKQWDGSVPAGGYLVQPKFDGIRGVCGPFGPNGSYEMLSRKGIPLSNVDQIIASLFSAIAAFNDAYHTLPVFDGELFYQSWETSQSIVMTESRHPLVDHLHFHAFDILSWEGWKSGEFGWVLQDRDEVLHNLLDKHGNAKLVSAVESMHSLDADEIRMIASAYVDAGWEGAVLKQPRSRYEFKRSPVWLKCKPFYDADVKIVGVEHGWLDVSGSLYQEDDPRVHEGCVRCVRSFLVDFGGELTNIGSGLTREQRIDLATKDVVGQTIEVRYQRVSADGKLIFPRVRGIRHDK